MTVSSIRIIALGVGCALAAMAPRAHADEPQLTAGAQTEVSSRYLWRGLALSDGAVLQPSAWLGWKGLSASAFGNVFLTGEGQQAFAEVDLTAGYAIGLGRVTLEPSLTAYLYPEGPDTVEVGLALTVSLDVLDAVLRQAVDLADDAGGYYAEIGVARELELGRGWVLDGSAALGWSTRKFTRWAMDVDGMAFTPCALLGDLGLKYTFDAGLYLRAHASASFLVTREMRAAVADPDLFAGALALGFDL